MDETQQIGPYRILEVIGRGGQGLVYLAEDTRLHRKVALKVLSNVGMGSEDTVTRFRREAEVASKLDHPGICAIYDAGVEGGVPYIAMRHVEGETVAQRIAASRDLSESGDDVPTMHFLDSELGDDKSPDDEVPSRSSTTHTRNEITRIVSFFEQTGRALHVAHESGIIHRDIKPSNIMITKDGSPVLLDFGLARDLEGDQQTLTRTGDLFGTPSYLSPEQLAAQRIPLDRRTDVYSLGVSLYEALTLQKPFEAPTRAALYQAIMTEDPSDARRLNPRIPRDLRVILDTALEKSRNRRYATALAFAEDLRRLRTSEPILARPIGPLGRTVRWARRRPWRAASVLMLFVLVAAVTWYVAKAPERRETARLAAERVEQNERKRFEELIQEGFILLLDEEPEQAIGVFEQSLKLGENDIEAVAGKARALEDLDQTAQAITWIDRHKVDGQLPAGLAHIRARIAAGSSFGPGGQGTKLPQPRTPQDYYLVSRTLAARAKTDTDSEQTYREAMDCINAAIDLSPTKRCLYFGRRLQLALRLKDPEATDRCIKMLERLFPGDAFAWFRIGYAHSDGDLRIAAFEKAVKLRSTFVSALNSLAQALKTARRYEEAKTQLEQCLSLNRRYAVAWASLSEIYRHEGNFHEALKLARRSLKYARGDRTRTLAHRHIGLALGMQGQHADAVRAFDEALGLSYRGRDAILWREKARALRAMGDLIQALEVLKRATESIRDNADLLFQLAYTHNKLGEKCLSDSRTDEAMKLGGTKAARQHFDEARSTYEKVIALKPDYALARNNLAWIMVNPDGHPDLREPKAALPLARRAVELDPRHSCHDTLAWAWYWLDEPQKAIKEEEKAIEALGKVRGTLEPEMFTKQLEKYKSNLERFEKKLHTNQ